VSKRLVFFNHKGGVSKTTSAYNIGWMLADDYRVLLVDADPQCNLSALVLTNNFDKYYTDDSTRLHNIKDGVSPAFDAKPFPIQPIECVIARRQKNLYLLPGHETLSEYDAALMFAHTSNNALTTLQNLPGAFAALVRLTEEKYKIDYTLIDLNPGLSAINQNLFLISDGFIVPTNPDPFSIMALDTLKTVLPRWVSWKSSTVTLFADSAYPVPAGNPKFIGTLIQRFNIRNGKAARPYRDNIAEIQQRVETQFVPALRKAEMAFKGREYDGIENSGYCLAQIPDFQGLLPKAHDAGVPVFALRDSEIKETGPILQGMKQRRDEFKHEFEALSDRVKKILAHA
jgi:chromosome partitioning protein